MDATTLMTLGEATTTVRWEPCPEARSERPGASLCAECGWPLEDHDPDGTGYHPARAA